MFSPNDPLLFLFVGIIVAAVLGQSIFFLVKSIRRAKEKGMDMTKIKKTIITAAIFTIAPAVAIVITVISLSKSLGIALPWLRLSVVGSLSYEAIAADNAARGMGFNSLAELAGKINASQYVTITIVMTVSIMVGIWLVPVVAKKYQNGLVNFENKDKRWSDILQNSLFIGMISAFVGFVFCDLSRLWSEGARYVTEKDMETENSIMIEGEKVSSVDSNSANEKSKEGAEKDNSKKSEEEENFYVKAWGPNGGIPGEMDNPFFFVEFSLPILKLEALRDEKVIQKKASEIMTITPALEGKYNFIDSKSIYFYPSEPANPFIKYEIHISENVKSISGKKLEGISDFSTPVAIVNSNPLKLLDSKAGVRKEIPDFYAPRYGLSQSDAKYALLSFNYFMTASEAESVLKARCISEDNVNVEELSFKLEPYFDKNSNIKGNRSRKFYIVLDGKISRGSTINLECVDSSSSYKTSETWKVAKPFRSLRYYNRSDYRNLAKYCFEFTIPVKEETVLNSFKISGMELTEKNFEVDDNEVYLKNIKSGIKKYLQ